MKVEDAAAPEGVEESYYDEEDAGGEGGYGDEEGEDPDFERDEDPHNIV